MEYKLPEGNNSTRVARDLREIEAYLKTRKEITHVTASIGGTPGRYNLVRSIANPSLSYGELIIDFTSPDALVDNMDEIQGYLTRHYPDAYVKLKRYNLMFKKYPIEAQFMGPDPPCCISWRTVYGALWRIPRKYVSSPPTGNRRYLYFPLNTIRR